MYEIFRENMKIIILFSSIALISASQVNPSPRSVNVALETSFLFEPKDIDDNLIFIKNIKEFLDKLYKILAPQEKNSAKQFRTESKTTQPTRKFNFGDFFKKLGESITNLTTGKLEDAIKIVQLEITKIADDGKAKINEILPDKNLKDYIKEAIANWRAHPEDLKNIIKTTMNEHNHALSKFARRMNTYYNYDDVKKLNKTLKKFMKSLENNMDASKVVNDLLQYAIFNKYQSLNKTTKAHLTKDLKLLSEFLMTNKKFKFKHHGHKNASLKRKSSPTTEVTRGTISVAEEPNHENDSVNADLRKLMSKITSDKTRKENNNKKKSVINNEIVVDNMELILS